MRIVEVENNIPFPVRDTVVVHVCDRQPESRLIIRKFKSRCGNTIEVHVTRRSGYIRSIKALDICQVNCADCFDSIKSIRELIAREYNCS